MKKLYIIFSCISFAIFASDSASGHNAFEYNWRPPFTVSGNAMPSLTILLDSSNSMHRMAYAWLSEKTNEKNIYETYGTEFNSQYNKEKEDPDERGYYGYFNPSSRYTYLNGKFVESNSTENTYSGSFMNWATMHRIDIIRKVMTGGRRTINNDYEVVTTNDLTRNILYTYDATNPAIPNFGILKTGDEISLIQTPNTNKLTIYKRIYKTQGNKLVFDKNLELVKDLNLVIQTDDPSQGVIDKYKTDARFALAQFHPISHKNAKIIVNMGFGEQHIEQIKNAINGLPLGGTAPLAEALWNVTAYLMQLNINETDDRYAPQYESDSFTPDKNGTLDPYFFETKTEYCAPQSIILLTPGESSFGDQIPISTRANNENKLIEEIIRPLETYKDPITNIDLSTNNKPYVIDTANFLRTTDLRPELPGKQIAKLYVIQAFGKGSTLLEDAAMYGGFSEKGNDIPPSPLYIQYGKNKNDIIERRRQYEDYADNISKKPLNYFAGDEGSALKIALTDAFNLAIRNVTSGTAAAVTSQTRSGEGAVYQALFFPPTDSDDKFAPAWSGQLHAFFIDSNGRMREDTLKNQILDQIDDYIIEFQSTDETVVINRYKDVDGNGTLEKVDTGITIQDINFLWSSSNTLNSNILSDSTIRLNRGYDELTGRYIITFVDKDKDMIVDADNNEVQEFELDTLPADTISPDNFYSYLTLFENSFSTSPYNTSMYTDLAMRQVEYIRGDDTPHALPGNTSDIVRPRNINSGPTWRLGDIVSSSPLVVGRPAANYHIIYNDETYLDFFNTYKNRRQVVFTGANDGMIHAFNAGFYIKDQHKFSNFISGETQYPLGTELWAYIPFNLLPHLRWLMNPSYGADLHVAYMDLPPRAYDVRIFNPDSDHPNGWGTILVAGMRFGGGQIQADIDKDQQKDNSDPVMSSSYVIIDITNPEVPPKPLAEIKMPHQGFTTCVPSIMPMTKANLNSPTDPDNQWYLVFGSGPANITHEAAPALLSENIKSDQNAELYVIDLKSLAIDQDYTKRLLKSYDQSTGAFSPGANTAAAISSNAFISDPASVDMDFNSNSPTKEFKSDVVYYGTVSGDSENPTGAMYRLLTNNIHTGWKTDSLLIDVGKPVSAAPSIIKDPENNLWIYFGSGRFFDNKDIPQQGDTEQFMSFYGVKDLAWNSTHFNTTTPPSSSLTYLFDSNNIYLDDYGQCGDNYQTDCVEVVEMLSNSTNQTMPGGWNTLVNTVSAYQGWKFDFTQPWERVLGQAATLGGTVLFTSYTPTTNVCNSEGDSRLYGLYYKTGTAYYDPIFGTAADRFSTFVGLGPGMAISPTMHISEDGTKAFIQTSSGAIIPIELNIDVNPKSLFWKKNFN